MKEVKPAPSQKHDILASLIASRSASVAVAFVHADGHLLDNPALLAIDPALEPGDRW
jgi:hypothetical protein